MKTRQIIPFNYCRMANLASILLGITVFLLPVIVVAQDFKGSEYCQDCHEDKYNDWKASGHPYKLMKGEQAKFRPIPLPKGSTWDDISYVIGGYKWKSRYMDTDGYIITTTKDDDGNDVSGVNQYNYLTGTWSNYHADEVKPYNCGACHTTNWVADEDHDVDNDLTDNQDGLPGIHGTFDIGGVHCEQCHGNDMTMTVDDSAEFCGNCHFRTSPPGSEVNSIPASGGWIRHHEQYNEFLAGPHAEMKCTTCHDPHKRGEFSIIKQCESCHAAQATSYAMTTMAGDGVECKDCHMPYATKNAQPTGPYKADLQTHIFYIDTDSEANMFTDDGLFVDLDDDGKAAVTLDFVCKRCHQSSDMGELGKFAKNFHGTDATKTELEYIGLNPGLTGTWWGGPSRDGEGFLLDFSYSGGGSLILFASFYTYDSEGNQVWLVAAGPATTGTTASVDVYITEGRKWGENYNPADGSETLWGTGEFTFPSCSGGTVILMPNQGMQDVGFTDLGYDLNRDLSTPAITCPSMAANNAP